MNDIAAVVMAAGKSKRMKTKTPKVLHQLMGKPIMDYVLEAAQGAGVEKIVVVIGHEREKVQQYIAGRAATAVQEQQNGTGHAVMQAFPALEGFKGDIMVLSGDMPLLSAGTIKMLMDRHRTSGATLTLLTAVLPDPQKLGRIVRDASGKLKSIMEAADASPDQLKIREINTGTYVFNGDFLREALPRIGSDNAQGEIYLTDTIEMAIKNGQRVEAVICDDYRESLGVNSRNEMALAVDVLKEKINQELMLSGVTIYHPANTYIEASVQIGNDTTILPGCMITGATRIGSDCVIGPNCRIESAVIGNGVIIRESVILESQIGDGTNVGPYAHVRPGTVVEEKGKIGNFVEIKKSHIGKGSKVPHLSYVGDATVGEAVNIGAGTITCNYDGVKKNPTIIKDGAFIGSNTCIVAPVTIGEGAATGAGAVVTKDVPDYKLAVGLPARAIKTIGKR